MKHANLDAQTVSNDLGRLLDEQVKASRKIAELELLKRSLDQVTTPTSKEMESASKFKNARDDLKASLSSIKAGLAASHADDGSPDARHVSAKVRNQLSMLHDAVSQVGLHPRMFRALRPSRRRGRLILTRVSLRAAINRFVRSLCMLCVQGRCKGGDDWRLTTSG